jgi:hypothetical protein
MPLSSSQNLLKEEKRRGGREAKIDCLQFGMLQLRLPIGTAIRLRMIVAYLQVS